MGGGRFLTECFVGPFLVVFRAEAVEARLLPTEIPFRLARRFSLEGLMHPLMAAVLLRSSRRDPLVLDTQFDPPYVQLREAAEGCTVGELR